MMQVFGVLAAMLLASAAAQAQVPIFGIESVEAVPGGRVDVTVMVLSPDPDQAGWQWDWVADDRVVVESCALAPRLVGLVSLYWEPGIGRVIIIPFDGQSKDQRPMLLGAGEVATCRVAVADTVPLGTEIPLTVDRLMVATVSGCAQCAWFAPFGAELHCPPIVRECEQMAGVVRVVADPVGRAGEARCLGDADGDGAVTVDETVLVVRNALGVGTCDG